MKYTRLNSFRSFALLGILCSILFTGCSPAVTVKIKPEAPDSASFTAEMTSTAENLVHRFTDKGNNAAKDNKAPFYNREKIIVSLARAGFKVDSLEFPTRTGIAANLSILKLDGVLGNAIVLKKDKGQITVSLSRESLNMAVGLMPPETRDYLDLLMAPIFTGEKINLTEYESVIASAYGKTIAGELKNSIFTLTVQCPSPIGSASISEPGQSSISGSSAIFKIPLSALLVLEKPLTARASWQ